MEEGGQRCIIPAETIFEPSYETGKAVRWGIQQPDQVPMGIAGIYESWKNTITQEREFSFSMLTVNADGLPQTIGVRSLFFGEGEFTFRVFPERHALILMIAGQRAMRLTAG